MSDTDRDKQDGRWVGWIFWILLILFGITGWKLISLIYSLNGFIQ
jgi:hypothetical protein